MNQLDIAKKILSSNNNFGEINEEEINMSLDDFVNETITSNNCDSICIRLDAEHNVIVSLIIDKISKVFRFLDYTIERYNDFCSAYLKINFDEKYNCAVSLNVNSVKTRVFALMPPLTISPDITISTTKTPPRTLSKTTISDEDWYEIVHSNFIIAGASGSGKTYHLNYLLNKYIGENERIAIIEEFGELIPPNDLTSSIIVPPPKPGEESLLKFVTQQSNLMRLDAFYVGEVKGGEAWPMVFNMSSGTRGGCSIHGSTVQKALGRLRALCQGGSTNNENSQASSRIAITINSFLAT